VIRGPNLGAVAIFFRGQIAAGQIYANTKRMDDYWAYIVIIMAIVIMYLVTKKEMFGAMRDTFIAQYGVTRG
jgi:hypothetical protein